MTVLENQNKPTVREQKLKVCGQIDYLVGSATEKKAQRPQEKTVVADRTSLHMIKRNLCTTVGQIQITLQEVDVCMSKSREDFTR